MAMRKASLVVFGILCAIATCGCVMGTLGGDSIRVTIKPKTVPGLGVFAPDLRVTQEEELDQPFPADLFSRPGLQSVHLRVIGLRTLVAGDFNEQGEAIDSRLRDPRRIERCEPAQARIDFMSSLQIIVETEDRSRREVIANYDRAPDFANCGFFMRIEEDVQTGLAFDLTSFGPRFRVLARITGALPEQTVKIGGFAAAGFVAHGSFP